MGVLEAMQGPIGVALGVMVTVLAMVGVVTMCRICCCKPTVNYTAVNHGLDEEEMAFKKSMEEHHGDDIDELFNFSGHEELEFDTNDLDNIEMLQTRRPQQGAEASASGVEIGLGKDDRNGNGGGDGAGSNARATLSDTLQEAEDLEALLEGGYRGGGATGDIRDGPRAQDANGAAAAKGVNGGA